MAACRSNDHVATMGHSSCCRILALLSLAQLGHTTKASSMELAAAADALLGSVRFDDTVGRDERFTVAANEAEEDAHGAYGEMPFLGMAEILSHPIIHGLQPRRNFVDFGSGSGRLVLGVAAMDGLFESVVGVEALEGLHAIACSSIQSAADTGAVAPEWVRSIRSATPFPHADPAVAAALRSADVCFMYSTAFPSEDGLRLPQLSASLACLLKEGCVVVTTDKFLVGDRYQFEALLPVTGADGEQICAFFWRVGLPPADSYDAALEDVETRWMGEDACEDNPEACEALLAAIGDEDGE